jgi:hypothetical protein
MSKSVKLKRAKANADSPAYDANIPVGTVGAMHELLVCADLLKRGYAVFRSVSPNAYCDMLMAKDGAILRVEVTTGCRTISGSLSFPPKKNRFDLLAIVEKNWRITYLPEFSALP